MNAIANLNAEWRGLGRSSDSARAVEILGALDDLVASVGASTMADLADYMRAGSGARAAAIVSVMVREADCHPLVARCLLQVLIPGTLSTGKRLQWGRGGPWADPEEFMAELLSVTWEVIVDWTGVDRPYAMLDVLSAARCRVRRQLFTHKDRGALTSEILPNHDRSTYSPLTGQEVLAMALTDLRLAGDESIGVEVVYATRVLGYSMAETVTTMGVGKLRAKRRTAEVIERLVAS